MITIHVIHLKSLWQKTRGLIGKEKVYAIYLKTRWGIHTFGMKNTIDVVILNKNNSVATLKENLKPRRIFLWNPLHGQVLELPPGYIKHNKILVGTQIRLEIHKKQQKYIDKRSSI